MRRKIKIIINNENIECFEGQTILEVAAKHKIDIPALCYHPDLCVKENCRLCVVEIKGKWGLHPACSTKVEHKMKIAVNSPKIHKTRKMNLELIFAQHNQNCKGCVWNLKCPLFVMAKQYGAKISQFPERKDNRKTYKFGEILSFDASQCIDCENCIEVCEKQKVGFLRAKKYGHATEVFPSKSKDVDCIYCGQCIVHCPVGAFEATSAIEEVEKCLKDKKRKVVFQFAPAVRTAVGGDDGRDFTGELVAGMKKLGADKVFDVCVGADVTTIEEAEELIERLEQNKNLPLITSCCPSWVKYVEFYYPEFVPSLTSVRSPHIILGGIIKSLLKNTTVVSVMPCVSKKYEVRRKELKLNGISPVDHVLTTRELMLLFAKNGINLTKIKPQKSDNPLGDPSGAGVIYGASGGVMESALRTAYKKITGEELANIEFKNVRGIKGFKKAEININGKTVKVGIVNGMENGVKILEELKKNPRVYDYVEVMACFGGCIGGGGQPVPINDKIRKQRAKGLYNIDKDKKLRLAHENSLVKRLYKDLLKSKKKIHSICHTSYNPRKK